MAHKNLIGGTAYDTQGGQCLVDGTGYGVKKGRTLVDGTGYDVVFSELYAVKITGTGSATLAYVVINGTTYTSMATVKVESGTVMTCQAKYYTPGKLGGVYLNGTRVATSGSYSYTVEKNITVRLVRAGSGTVTYGLVEIDEE